MIVALTNRQLFISGHFVTVIYFVKDHEKIVRGINNSSSNKVSLMKF